MSYLIRLLHVGTASFLIGGAILILILYFRSRSQPGTEDWRWLLDAMSAYEWGFWAAIGLIVATGIGNIGAFGDGLPDPDSTWGRDFTAKLSLALAFVVFLSCGRPCWCCASRMVMVGELRCG